MPALGMAQDSGVIVAWRKALGDAVAVGDPLFDVETDKTTMEVEASHAGFLTEIRADTGADVPIGQTIAIISTPGGAGPDLPETARTPETKPSTASPAPAALKTPEPSTPPTPQTKPAEPSALSAAPTAILASPKAKFEAHRRGIDLRRLVEQGLPQPFHVADLERLKPETVLAASAPQTSVLTAAVDWAAFDEFVAWAEGKTGEQAMRQVTLAAMAAGAFRAEVKSGRADGITISILSAKAKSSAFALRDPDLHGLGDLAGSILEGGDVRVDLTLVDLSGTRLVDYRPATQPGLLSVVIADDGAGEACVNLHFCEDDLPLIAAMRFLDSFAARVAEPAMQLL